MPSVSADGSVYLKALGRVKEKGEASENLLMEGKKEKERKVSNASAICLAAVACDDDLCVQIRRELFESKDCWRPLRFSFNEDAMDMETQPERVVLVSDIERFLVHLSDKRSKDRFVLRALELLGVLVVVNPDSSSGCPIFEHLLLRFARGGECSSFFLSHRHVMLQDCYLSFAPDCLEQHKHARKRRHSSQLDFILRFMKAVIAYRFCSPATTIQLACGYIGLISQRLCLSIFSPSPSFIHSATANDMKGLLEFRSVCRLLLEPSSSLVVGDGRDLRVWHAYIVAELRLGQRDEV